MTPKKKVVAAKAAAPKAKLARRPKSLKGPALRAHADTIFRRLAKEFPDAHCELDFRSPLELVVATILSAQCTDKRVNMVTPALFRRYPTAAAMAAARVEDLEEIIRSTGFYHNKAKSIIGMARVLVAHYGGEVPRSLEELVVLPGVGRKTANVVLGNAFGINEGVVVDTHVARLSHRLGLTKETDPVKIELALIPLFERGDWMMLAHLLIWHGRRTCDARKPNCAECVLGDICPSAV